MNIKTVRLAIPDFAEDYEDYTKINLVVSLSNNRTKHVNPKSTPSHFRFLPDKDIWKLSLNLYSKIEI